jgi:predicted ester cyclase
MNTRRLITTTGVAVIVIFLGTLATRGLARPSASGVLPQSDQCAARLATFDTLDFDIFSNQTWDRLSESHANDIVVTWPDGHETTGLAGHIEDLKSMFVFAPNTNIAEHPIRICSGDYTAVTGVMTGNFSQPMPTAGGKTIAPTGKSFRLTMATIGHWKGTTMDHEWLFWDNQAFMRQIGLAQ